MPALPPMIDLPPRRLRTTLKCLHLWLGLSAGVVFAIVALSGTLLVYQHELLLWSHPELARAALPAPTERGETLGRLIAEWRPQAVTTIELPAPALPVFQAYFADGSRRYFDPGSGELLLLRTTGNDWLLWLRQLHTHLLAGRVGEQVLGVFGLLAVFLLGSGLYLWWPRASTFAAHLRLHASPPTRRWLSWHRSAGALLLPLTLLITLTGVAMLYHGTTRAGLRAAFGDGPELVPPAPIAARDAAIDWPAVLAVADAALAGGELRRVAVPTADNALVAIRMRAPREWHPVGRSVVWVDPYRAEVIQVHDATRQGRGARIDEAMYPLHGGFIGGAGWKLAVAVSGVLPSLLAVTGLLFWRARRRRV